MQCSGGSRCLQRRWEPWRWGAQCLAIRNWQRPIESHHQSWSSYDCEKLPKNSRLSILQLFGIRRKLKRWKSSMSGYLISWLQIKKIVTLKCCLLLPSQEQWTISQSDCDVPWKVDFIWQPATTGWSEKTFQSTSQSQTCTKKKSHSHCLVVCCSSDPLQLSESRRNLTSEKHAQQINELHQKLQWLSSGCWSAEWAQFFSTTMPYCTLHNQCFRSWMNWTVKFCLICHVHLTSCQLTTTSSSISTTSCRKNASTTSKMQERLSKSSSNPKAQIFMLQK